MEAGDVEVLPGIVIGAVLHVVRSSEVGGGNAEDVGDADGLGGVLQEVHHAVAVVDREESTVADRARALVSGSDAPDSTVTGVGTACRQEPRSRSRRSLYHRGAIRGSDAQALWNVIGEHHSLCLAHLDHRRTIPDSTGRTKHDADDAASDGGEEGGSGGRKVAEHMDSNGTYDGDGHERTNAAADARTGVATPAQ